MKQQRIAEVMEMDTTEKTLICSNDIHTLAVNERNYTFAQSQQISMQTGLIGYLRADFGASGKEFYSSWNDFRTDLKTDEFKAEFDTVINALREQGNILADRASLSHYCYTNPTSSFNDDRNHYGVRIDTEKYSYLCRLNPNRGEYNLYCYCYKKEWLNRHLEHAGKGIRFINRNYNEKFRIADGEKIRITMSDGSKVERVCRYIDDYHLEVGSNLYHICEFAERMEKNGNKVEPINQPDPPKNKARNKDKER